MTIGILAAPAIGQNGGQPVVLDEEAFTKLFVEGSLALKAQEAQRERETVQVALGEEAFGSRLKVTGGRFKSNELPPIPFQPTITPVDDVNVSIQKMLRAGVRVEGGAFASQKSALDNSFTDATQVGARLSLRMDLGKNRLGKLDDVRLRLNDTRLERQNIETEIVKKEQEIAARKLYWSLIANLESTELAMQLEKSAERQLAEARERQRLSVADAGEIARYRSQLQSRKGSILLFEHERELLWQAFRLQTAGLEPDNYRPDLQAARKSNEKIGRCLAQVMATKKPDPGSTLLDEQIELYRKELADEITTSTAHSQSDLALIISSQTTGVDKTYGGALSNTTESFRTGNYIGLEFSMPLGDTQTRTEKALIAAKKLGLEVQADMLASEVSGIFRSMERNLLILQKGLATQKENSGNLKVSYREMQRKFDKGRIPISMVISEQDALFQSELQEISFQKQIVHTLLDYFAVFTQFPCEWNNLAALNGEKGVNK